MRRTLGCNLQRPSFEGRNGEQGQHRLADVIEIEFAVLPFSRLFLRNPADELYKLAPVQSIDQSINQSINHARISITCHKNRVGNIA
jgi:hypothetical protein